jgi:hypothetical protein
MPLLEGIAETLLQGVFEGACYWMGKLALMPFGIRCSADDQWGLRRKKRGQVKPPWTWMRTERRYLRSDVVQLIGLAVIILVIGAFVLLGLTLR